MRTTLTSTLRRVSLAVALAAAVAPAVRADAPADLRGLLDETVVTTASLTAETGTEAPATSTTLTADDIRRYGLHTLDEAIDFLSLGAVSSNPLHTPDLAARGVLLRGDNGNHMLLLIDGHATNEALQGSTLFGRGLGVPLEMVDHIEIILGPGSVLYGSSAMLGVINVVTKRAKDYRGAHITVESEAAISARVMVGAGATFSLFGTPGEVTVGAEVYRREGPDFTLGPQFFPFNPYTGKPYRFRRDGVNDGVYGGVADDSHFAENAAGYAQARVGELSLRLQAFTFKRAAPYRSAAVQNTADWNDPDTYELDRAVRADLSYERRLTGIVGVTGRAYADAWDRQSFVDSSDAATVCRNAAVVTCRFSTPERARWTGAEMQGSFDWARDGRFVSLLGVDGRLRFAGMKQDLHDYDTGEALRPSYAVVDTSDPSLGAYLQNTLRPTGWFGANLGARVDADPQFSPVLSPRAAITVSPWAGGTLKAVYAEAFRAPSFRERLSTIPDFQLSPGDLHPERVRSVEGSLAQTFGSHRALIGVFRSWWTDLIEHYYYSDEERAELVRQGLLELTATLGAVNQYRNVASIDNYGANGSLEGSFLDGRLRYAANATAAIARRQGQAGTPKRSLEVAPRVFGNARVSYELPEGWPTVALAGHFMSRRIADRGFDGAFVPLPKTPPQVEVRATLSGPVPRLRGLSYRVSANAALSDESPYVIGQRQFATPGNESAELAPYDTFRVTVGLHYDFEPSR